MKPSITPLLCLGCSILVALTMGCASVHPRHQIEPLPPVVPEAIPRELCKVTLPDYVIEPPDVLMVDAIDIVPLPPYRLNSLDVVSINVEGTPLERPIQGDFPIEPGGLLNLGFEYGKVKVGGLPIDEAEERITAHLRNYIREPVVFMTLSQIRGLQEIQGEHLVAPDGKINLGTYGRVRVVGLTIEEATAAIESHLANFLENPKIAVDVFGYNSKVYYVITQGAGLGDQIVKMPVMGNETVLDAISNINGLTSVSSKRIWVARPGRNSQGGDQILPVNWLAMTQRADTETNFQILPGDRVYVAEDRLVAFDNALAKIIAPVERTFGFTLLGTSVVQRLRFFSRFNGNFGGF
jgi:polysaccharide export outer membrane protein